MKQNMVPLTVIILTHRHDERFKKAKTSAQWAQEVLVADFTGKKPIDDFSAVRNALLKKAKHEWVLFLDSDEVIEEKSWPHIETLIRNPQLSGVWVRRHDVFYGTKLKFGEAGNTWLLRLVRKNKAKFLRPVHEIVRVQGTTQYSRIQLIHFSHTSIREFLQDVTSYAANEAKFQRDSQLPVASLAIKTVAYPTLKFFVHYFGQLGFLDGWRGLVYAVLMSLHSLFVRVFSYENR